MTLLVSTLCSIASATEVYMGLEAYGSGGKALGVGLASFSSADDPDSKNVAAMLRSIIREDLLFERLFSVTEGGPAPANNKVDSLAWSGLGAQVLISGSVNVLGDAVELDVKVYDVSRNTVLFGKQGTGTRSEIRRLAHLMSDQLTYQMSGQPGLAHTRIVFANDKSGHKELYVMDYDGENVRRLTRENSITLLPKWSPDGKLVVFNSYREGNPDAYLLNYPGGELHELSMRQGLNTAPTWSPDGTEIALTLSRGETPDIFIINRSGNIIRRLTHASGVNTSPCFSPNGQQIVFVSDRSGIPELYVMDAAGAGVKRLTFGQWTDAPAWSPRGDWIAYERQRADGIFDIFVVDPNGQNNQALTESQGRNESPSWSPDGRFIVFASNREGRRRVYIMGADGSSPHPVGHITGDSFDPSWGP
jgi:TolB protein